MVQVVKDPLGTKGARLSTQISMAGRMLVYLPHDPHIGISQKIDSETERTQLRERLQALMPEGEKGGFIVRTQAEGANDDELNADVASAQATRCGAGAHATGPRPAAPGPDAGAACAARHGRSNTGTILVDSRTTTASMLEWARTYTPSVVERVRHYSGERPLFDTANVDESRARCRGAWT